MNKKTCTKLKCGGIVDPADSYFIKGIGSTQRCQRCGQLYPTKNGSLSGRDILKDNKTGLPLKAGGSYVYFEDQEGNKRYYRQVGDAGNKTFEAI